MPSKCDKCEKVKALQAKIERLQLKIQKLQEGDIIRKVHFDLDGEYTACGLELFEQSADVTENIKEVTCRNCHRKWNAMQREWDREQKAEENERINI